MKKTLFLLLLFCVELAQAQIVVTKFKFIKDSPMGCCPGRKATDLSFKNTSGRTFKYLKIHYSGVNQVQDAVSSDIVGAVNANVKHTKYKIMTMTGPFESGKKISRYAPQSFYYASKVIAFPAKIEIQYMDGEEDEIIIKKENISTFFPSLNWLDVNYENGL